MIVEDVTSRKAPRKSRRKSKRSSKSKSKAVLDEFEDQDANRLAVVGKRIYRLYTCVENMFPDNETTLYQHFFDYLVTTEGDSDHADTLKAVGSDPKLRKRLLTFVSFISRSTVI